jgi:hypothetical protein
MDKNPNPGQAPWGTADSSAIITPHTLVISLGEEHQKQLQSCLDNSGKVTFSMKELTVTNLPEMSTRSIPIIID